MSSYPAPTQTLPLFNSSLFASGATNLDTKYIKYPLTQSGTITFKGPLVLSDGIVNSYNNTNQVLGYGSSTSLGTNNSGYGYSTLDVATSNNSNNSSFGSQTLKTLSNGTDNSAFGYQSLYSLNASYTTAFGSLAGQNNTTGDYNTYLGYSSGQTNTNGENNTYLGANTNCLNNGIFNSTSIGYGAISTASNQIMLGRASEKVTIPNQIAYSYSSVPTLGSTSLGYVYTTTTVITGLLTSGGVTLCSITNVAVGVYIAVAVLTFTSVGGSAGISGVFQNGEYSLNGFGNQCLNLSNITTNSTANATISVNGRVANGTAGTASSVYFKLIRIA